jgi:hypothetical protein
VDSRRIADQDEAAGACYAEGMAATWIRPSRLPESPRFREFGWAMNEVYAKYFPKGAPARSTVQAAGLPRDALVEIELAAAL